MAAHLPHMGRRRSAYTSSRYAAAAECSIADGGHVQADGSHQQQRRHWHTQQPQGNYQYAATNWQAECAPPPPPPRYGPQWKMAPLHILPYLVQQQQPYLEPDPPVAADGASLVVKLHLRQARRSTGHRKLPSMETIMASLFRIGLMRPNSTQPWAARHQLRKDGTVLVTVLDTPAAQAAAQAVVAAKRVTVGEGDAAITIPVSWADTAQPAGCVVVTLHQLPPQYARKGIGVALLEAAQQQGHVVAEFLGGSVLMGDAHLACPAADTVVMWVQPPQEDPLLTHLPTSFDPGVPGSPPVRIEVAGRPSLAPHTWQQLTQHLLRMLQPALDRISAESEGRGHTGQQQQHRQQQQPQQMQQPQPQQRQQQQQPQQQQQLNAMALDLAPARTQHHQDRWLRQQIDEMLAMAVTIADDEADEDHRSLAPQQRRLLQDSFAQHFHSTLRQQECPPEPAVRTWLRQQLGITRLTYDSDSREDASDEDMTDARDNAPTQQSQQQQQVSDQQRSRRRSKQTSTQQMQPRRRSERQNLGRMSQGYATVFGAGGCDANAPNPQLGTCEGILPPTPAAATPQQRARGRARGRR